MTLRFGDDPVKDSLSVDRSRPDWQQVHVLRQGLSPLDAKRLPCAKDFLPAVAGGVPEAPDHDEWEHAGSRTH